MGVGDLINSENFGRDVNPVTRDESNIVEVTGLAVQNALDNYNTFSASNLKSDELFKQQEMIETITGRGLYDVIGDDARSSDILRYERVDELLNSNPELYAGVPNSEQVLLAAQDRARMTAQELEQASINASAFESGVGNVLGGMSGAAVDPINLALLPVGAGAGKNILQAVMIEAGINAGAEAATQPAIAAWQREIGNEYGFTDAVTNVGFAALLGGAFTGLVRGVQPTASIAFEYIAKSDGIPGAAKNAIKQLADYAHIKERNPYEDNGLNFDKHIENINATSRAFEMRRSIDDVIIDTLGMRKEYLADPYASSVASSPFVPSRSSAIPALFSSSSLNTSPLRDGLNIASLTDKSGALTQSLASGSQRTASNISPSNSFATATISPLRNPAAVSIGRISSTSNYIVYQPSKDVNKIIDLANKEQPELSSFLQDSVKGVKGAEFYGARVKETKSLKDKLKGKGRSIDGIGDVLGGRVVVDNYEAMNKVIEYLKANARIIEVENKLTSKNKGVYRAAHFIISSKNGLSAEIQIQPREVRAVQDEAHDIYKRWQHADAKKLSPEQFIERKRDLAKSQKMFDKAWKKWSKRNKGQKIFDEESRITPLVDEPSPRTTPADVDSDISVNALAKADQLQKSLSNEVLDDAEVSRIRDAEDAELRRLAEDDPDFRIELDDADLQELFPGKTNVRFSDILEARESDTQLLDAIKVCAIG